MGLLTFLWETCKIILMHRAIERINCAGSRANVNSARKQVLSQKKIHICRPENNVKESCMTERNPLCHTALFSLLGCVCLLVDNVKNDACKPYRRADNLNDTDAFFCLFHNVFHPPRIFIFLLCIVYFVWIGSSEIGTLCS